MVADGISYIGIGGQHRRGGPESLFVCCAVLCLFLSFTLCPHPPTDGPQTEIGQSGSGVDPSTCGLLYCHSDICASLRFSTSSLPGHVAAFWIQSHIMKHQVLDFSACISHPSAILAQYGFFPSLGVDGQTQPDILGLCSCSALANSQILLSWIFCLHSYSLTVSIHSLNI